MNMTRPLQLQTFYSIILMFFWDSPNTTQMKSVGTFGTKCHALSCWGHVVCMVRDISYLLIRSYCRNKTSHTFWNVAEPEAFFLEKWSERMTRRYQSSTRYTVDIFGQAQRTDKVDDKLCLKSTQFAI